MNKETTFNEWPQGRYVILGLILTVLICGTVDKSAHKCSGQSNEPAKLRVRVTSRCEGGKTHIVVENQELTEVAVTFDFSLSNLVSSVTFPYTATFSPGQTTTAFSLEPMDSTQPSSYIFTNFYKLGSSCAVHDDGYRYRLPFASGKSFRVTQGYGGKFSHRGPNHYAIDWRMPVGTPVHAARGGQIVKVCTTSNRGGSDKRFEVDNNYILIRHSDGTLGQYCHLRQAGAAVQEGDEVSSGDLIGYSGNTGFSSGPHLHFAVFKAKNGKERETLPVKFRSQTLKAGTEAAGRFGRFDL